ncbi:hypothetical protein B9Z55_027977 [Caenorhabditis nigoni]|uniref:Uncharacterized protein n=1 Tax=Caenorhabditis nigoni TaxID=1611254 RepID=A0A2G5SE08_9PELO|nr:hypothetical protein B9Z55_027977 [Caenorhabditis nigoni]
MLEIHIGVASEGQQKDSIHAHCVLHPGQFRAVIPPQQVNSLTSGDNCFVIVGDNCTLFRGFTKSSYPSSGLILGDAQDHLMLPLNKISNRFRKFQKSEKLWIDFVGTNYRP